MQNIQQMISEHGGLAAVRANYLRLENPPYMRLVVEIIGPVLPNGSCEVSVAHYGEMNGDQMRDPDLTFLVTPNDEAEWQWQPLTFTNDYVGVYQVAAEHDNFGQLCVRNAKMVRDLNDFAAAWDQNIKQQGFIEAFRQQHVRTSNGVQFGETSAVQ